MRTFTAVIEHDVKSNLYLGHIPGWPDAHAQGATRDEVDLNLSIVLHILLDDGEPPVFEREFVGIYIMRTYSAEESLRSIEEEGSRL